MTVPGFTDWLNHRGSMLFGDLWWSMEMFSTTEVFKLLGKKNYAYPRNKGRLPLPDGYEKGRWVWSKAEAEKLWHWAYGCGWFNAMEEDNGTA